MTTAISLRSNDLAEDLGLLIGERPCPEAFAGHHALHFEFSSRGDRVPGRVILPATDGGPYPLVLLQPDAGESMQSDPLNFAAPWVNAGAAVATIDLSLHGERSSPKFSERLLATLQAIRAGSDTARDDENGIALFTEFVRQSLCDLARTLDVLLSLPSVAPKRIAFVGIGMGGNLGALFCGLDPRARATALVHAGSGGPKEVDPAAFISRIAPRPLLLIQPESGGPAARLAGDALFAATGDSCRQLTRAGDGSRISKAAAESVWNFLAEPLGLA